MQSIRMIAMDLDGTLLTDDKRLTDRNLAALERAAAAGIAVVPATGRIYAGLPEIIRGCPFIRYMILANGATVYDGETETVLYRAEISKEMALEVMSRLDGYPVIYDCYQDGKGWMTAEMWNRAELYAPSPFYLQHIRTLRKPVPDLKEHIRTTGKSVQKIQAFCRTTETQAQVLEGIRRSFPELAVTSSVARNVEINDGRAKKGAGLAALAEHLGIALSETIAFGDGTNDLSMIKTAGTGVAMGNAVPAVLEAADCITETNNDDGVGRMIERMLDEKRN